MAKLVLLSEGMTGRTHELKAEKTTIGRLEDNAFQIAEPSVSSHHCEVLLKGEELHVQDLGSTNGTFIGQDRVTEATLKPGQVLRLGQVQMRFETGAPQPASPKKLDQTMVMRRGVSINELVDTSARAGGFDTASKGFSKKDNKGNLVFWVVVGVIGFALLAGIGYLILKVKS